MPFILPYIEEKAVYELIDVPLRADIPLPTPQNPVRPWWEADGAWEASQRWVGPILCPSESFNIEEPLHAIKSFITQTRNIPRNSFWIWFYPQPGINQALARTHYLGRRRQARRFTLIATPMMTQ